MRSDDEDVVCELTVTDDEDRIERKRRDARERDAVRAAQPATIAARCLLRKALGTRFETMVGRPQALMLVVPDPLWGGPVRDAWRLHFKGGAWEQSLGNAAPESASEHDWFSICQPERLVSTFSKSVLSAAEVERALAAGGELLVIAHDLEAVPPAVRAAMDRVVELPPMDWAVLKHVAETVYGPMKGRTRMADEDAAAVGPSALRLAVRRGSTAMDYARRAMRIASEADARPMPEVQHVAMGLARVPGMGAALAWGRSLATDLAAYRRGDLPWSAVDRGAPSARPSDHGGRRGLGRQAQSAGEGTRSDR